MTTLRRTKMKGWFEYYRETCPICHKVGGCLRNEKGDVAVCIRVKSDREFSKKFPSWLHYLSTIPQNEVRYGTANQTHKKHDDNILDNLYRNLVLNKLRLTDSHLAHLTSPTRGLTPEAIAVRGYKSFEFETVNALKFDSRLQLGGLPGLYRDKNDEWRLHGVEGIMIPFRNPYNEIVGFQIRVDNPPNDVVVDRTNFPELHAVVKKQPNVIQVLVEGEIIYEGTAELGNDMPINYEGKQGSVKLIKGQRYFWLSSATKREGTGAGDPTPVHMALPSYKLAEIEATESDTQTSVKSDAVWITEGSLKADIAIDHIVKAYSSEELQQLGDVMLAVPGVNTWRTILPYLETMGVKRVNLTFDMDAMKNPDVAMYVKDFIQELKHMHIHTNFVIWNLKEGKGIDDIFVQSNKKPIIKPLF